MRRAATVTITRARTWLIASSLAITAVNGVFFVLAPAFGYPLTPDQAIRLVQIIVPVFAGYLGSAVHFVFATTHPRSPRRGADASTQLGLLVRGPVVVFCLWTGAALAAFGVSNSSRAAPGSGMSVDTLALNITLALAMLTAVTNAIVAYAFGREPEPAAVGAGRQEARP
jgi:hypothetical protein